MSTRPIIIGGLLLAGAWLVYLGVNRWMDQRAAGATVEEFLVAVRDGDHATASGYLSDDRRAALRREVRRTSKPFETTIDGLRWDISSLEVDGRRGTAELRIEKSGFKVTPVLHLVKSDANEWKIDRIENLFVDPAWETYQRDRARQRDEGTAKELKSALRNSPNAQVKRVGAGNDGDSEAR